MVPVRIPKKDIDVKEAGNGNTNNDDEEKEVVERKEDSEKLGSGLIHTLISTSGTTTASKGPEPGIIQNGLVSNVKKLMSNEKKLMSNNTPMSNDSNGISNIRYLANNVVTFGNEVQVKTLTQTVTNNLTHKKTVAQNVTQYVTQTVDDNKIVSHENNNNKNVTQTAEIRNKMTQTVENKNVTKTVEIRKRLGVIMDLPDSVLIKSDLLEDQKKIFDISDYALESKDIMHENESGVPK